MTHRDEELGLPGNREIVEHALRESTAQVVHLAPPGDPGEDRGTLAERAANLLRGFDRVPADSAVSTTGEPVAPDTEPADDLRTTPEDILGPLTAPCPRTAAAFLAQHAR